LPSTAILIENPKAVGLYRIFAIIKYIAKCVMFVFKPWIRIKTNSSLPKDRPLIFVFNHNSTFETVFLAAYLITTFPDHQFHFVIDWMYGRIPIIGWILNRLNPIYVYNKPARLLFIEKQRRSIEKKPVYPECLHRLEEGNSLVLFPEGTRNKDPFRLKRGRKGIGKIVLHSQTRVIPIGLDFPNRIKTGKIPKFGRLYLNIGKPLDFIREFHQLQDAKTRNLSAKRCQNIENHLVSQITFKIMQQLSSLCGKRYTSVPPKALQFDKIQLNEGGHDVPDQGC
jgi:1-acyl-sn-glycerol-3-phosphate acyltransferase